MHSPSYQSYPSDKGSSNFSPTLDLKKVTSQSKGSNEPSQRGEGSGKNLTEELRALMNNERKAGETALYFRKQNSDYEGYQELGSYKQSPQMKDQELSLNELNKQQINELLEQIYSLKAQLLQKMQESRKVENLVQIEEVKKVFLSKLKDFRSEVSKLSDQNLQNIEKSEISNLSEQIELLKQYLDELNKIHASELNNFKKDIKKYAFDVDRQNAEYLEQKGRENQQKQEEIANLSQESKKKEAEIDGLKQKDKRLQEDLDQLNYQLEELQQEKEKIIAEKQQQLKTLRDREQAMEAKKQEGQEQFVELNYRLQQKQQQLREAIMVNEFLMKEQGLVSHLNDPSFKGLAMIQEQVEGVSELVADEVERVKREWAQSLAQGQKETEKSFNEKTMKEMEKANDKLKKTIENVNEELQKLRLIQELKSKYQSQLDSYDDHIRNLEKELESKQISIEDLEHRIEDKDEYIHDIKSKIDQLSQLQQKQLKSQVNTQKKRMHKLKRLNQNEFLFGGKVINAKVSNGRLLFRTGGGYIMFEEFLTLYAKDQINEFKAFAEKEGLNIEDAMRVFEQHYIDDFYLAQQL